jgi:hypothetical protein
MRSAAIAMLTLSLVIGAIGCAGPPIESGSTISPSASDSPPASAIPSDPVNVSASPSSNASPPTEEPLMSFSLTSTAFSEGGEIPRLHTCDGDDVSPPLAWSGSPDGTVSLALIVDDPDAGGFVHWVAFAIDPVAGSLPEGVSGVAGGPAEGRNGFGDVGYGGPCPPSGSHRYVFRLLALDATPTFKDPPSASEFRAAISGHVLLETTLTGTYRRGG